MRKVTQEILKLNLFNVIKIEPGDMSYVPKDKQWDVSDSIVVYADDENVYSLQICLEGETATDRYSVGLHKAELDLQGEVFNWDYIWIIWGDEADIMQQLQTVEIPEKFRQK